MKHIAEMMTNSFLEYQEKCKHACCDNFLIRKPMRSSKDENFLCIRKQKFLFPKTKWKVIIIPTKTNLLGFQMRIYYISNPKVHSYLSDYILADLHDLESTG